MLLKIVRVVIRFLFKLLTRVEIIGFENIPKQGGVLLASNHISRLDAPLVFALLRREKATCLVAKKYQKKPFFRWLVNAVDGIWINRQETDFRALRETLAFLRDGWLIGISPEGTRSPSGALTAAKIGVAYLADKASVPVVPIGITGTHIALDQLKRLRRGRIMVRFGEPFGLPPVKRRKRDEALQRNTDEIMCQIAALLPPEYRGVFADHPRLEELLNK